MFKKQVPVSNGNEADDPRCGKTRQRQPAWQHDGIRVINAAEWMADGLVRILVDGDYTELCKTSLEDAVNAFETVDEQ